MGWKCVRGLLGLAVVCAAAGSVLAQEDFYTASTASFGGVDIPQPGSSLTDAGIDRLLAVNATPDSLLRDVPTGQAQDNVFEDFAPVNEVAATQSSGTYLLAGLAAAFALGLGLCFAGIMSGRQRTINTFATGFIQLK